jgi:hypothetical protein
MKLTKKNLQPLLFVILLTMVAGSLAWFIIELIFTKIGIPFSLSTGRIGFDIEIIAFYFNMNPGTVLGIFAGFFIFRII